MTFMPMNLMASCAAWVRTGSGFYYQGNNQLGTAATLGNGNLRLDPVFIPTACTISALFAEFTAAGDATSLLATALYTDDGNGMPKSLLITGPTISTGTGNAGNVATGGTPGVYQGAVSQAVQPGLYWLGGVLQGVTTTQPTFRVATFGIYPNLGPTSLPATNTAYTAYYQSGVTGALPATFALTAASTPCPRVGFRVA